MPDEPLSPETGTTEQEPATQPERPDWLPENFADEKAFLTSYQEAQRKITEQGQELSRLRDDMEQYEELLTQQPAQQQGFDPMQHPLIRGGQDALESGDFLGVAAALQSLLGQSQQQPAENQGASLDPFVIQQLHEHVASQYGGDDLRDRALEIMETNPALFNAIERLEQDPKATVGDLEPIVSTAYGLAQRETLMKTQETSLAQQQQETENARQRKLEQESLSGAGPTRVASKSEQEQTWDAIKNADDGKLRIGYQ